MLHAYRKELVSQDFVGVKNIESANLKTANKNAINENENKKKPHLEPEMVLRKAEKNKQRAIAIVFHALGKL